MRKVLVPCLFAAIAVAALRGACAGGSSSVDPADPVNSVDSFVSLATDGIDVDFDALASPADAVGKAHLIVEGNLVDVVDGISVRFADPAYTARRAKSYATLVVAVDSVISGDPTKVHSGRVYLVVLKSTGVSAQQLSVANPRPHIVAVLHNVTTWTPSKDSQVIRPAAVPSGAPLYAPYTDGMWMQGSGDITMRGFYVDPKHLAAPWGRPDTVDKFVDALRRAATTR